MNVIPDAWLPAVPMKRVHGHWTAGGHEANETDRKAYHLLVEGDGKLVRGSGRGRQHRDDLVGDPIRLSAARHDRDGAEIADHDPGPVSHLIARYCPEQGRRGAPAISSSPFSG